MDNIDGQRKLTSHDSSQNEQQDGANHGDDRERQSEETKTREGAQLAPEALRVVYESLGDYGHLPLALDMTTPAPMGRSHVFSPVMRLKK